MISNGVSSERIFGFGYDNGMKAHTPEMARFNDALRQVTQVSKAELDALRKDQKAIEATRQKRGPRPKSSVSGHASRDKD